MIQGGNINPWSIYHYQQSSTFSIYKSVIINWQMDKINPPDPLTFGWNIKKQWKLWKQELENYSVAKEKDKKKNKVKSSILLSCVGPEGSETHNVFTFSQEEESFNCNSIVQKFESFRIPRKNMTLLRYKFLLYKHKEGKTFDEFRTQLKRFSGDCEFGELKDILVKQEAEIYFIKFMKETKRCSQLEKKILRQCKYCGRTHMRGACPVFHRTCKNCQKKDTLPTFACPLTNF